MLAQYTHDRPCKIWDLTCSVCRAKAIKNTTDNAAVHILSKTSSLTWTSMSIRSYVWKISAFTVVLLLQQGKQSCKLTDAILVATHATHISVQTADHVTLLYGSNADGCNADGCSDSQTLHIVDYLFLPSSRLAPCGKACGTGRQVVSHTFVHGANLLEGQCAAAGCGIRCPDTLCGVPLWPCQYLLKQLQKYP